MAGKTPHEAVSNFLAPLSLVVSCFTKSVLRHVGGYAPETSLCALSIGEDGRFKPRSHDGNVYLSVLMQYRIVEGVGERGPYKVKTVSYFYAIENRKQQELAAYHWHPEGTEISFPHIHFGKGVIKDSPHNLQEKHYPTGRISVEEFLMLAVREFGVRPIKAEWKTILEETQRRFDQWKTWR